MDISLVAKMKKYDEFISCYNEGDEKKLYKGKSLLFYSLSNNDAESRYLITDKKDRLPLQYVVNMKYTDEELEPLYQIWFSQNNVLVNHKNAWGKTPLEIAEKMPYRASLLERMKKYE